mmetsp:Transcript_116043/g.374864  ORF Transcript_116043/g.374864 Transcript_116043/m.374864 type:complete len:328 (+) Transcript_116043:627-1610(+)
MQQFPAALQGQALLHDCQGQARITLRGGLGCLGLCCSAGSLGHHSDTRSRALHRDLGSLILHHSLGGSLGLCRITDGLILRASPSGGVHHGSLNARPQRCGLGLLHPGPWPLLHFLDLTAPLCCLRHGQLRLQLRRRPRPPLPGRRSAEALGALPLRRLHLCCGPRSCLRLAAQACAGANLSLGLLYHPGLRLLPVGPVGLCGCPRGLRFCLGLGACGTCLRLHPGPCIARFYPGRHLCLPGPGPRPNCFSHGGRPRGRLFGLPPGSCGSFTLRGILRPRPLPAPLSVRQASLARTGHEGISLPLHHLRGFARDALCLLRCTLGLHL